jgi:hypothetical protein
LKDIGGKNPDQQLLKRRKGIMFRDPEERTKDHNDNYILQRFMFLQDGEGTRSRSTAIAPQGQWSMLA